MAEATLSIAERREEEKERRGGRKVGGSGTTHISPRQDPNDPQLGLIF